MNNKKIKHILITTTIIIIIALPFLIDKIIFANSMQSHINNGEWASFLGSYLGGTLGGAATLLAVVWTINDNKKSQKEDKRLGLMPLLKIDIKTINKDKFKGMPDIIIFKDHKVKYGEKLENKEIETVVFTIRIKNIGLGSALDIYMKNIYIGNKLIPNENKIYNVFENVLSISDKDEIELIIMIERTKTSKEFYGFDLENDEILIIEFEFKDMLRYSYTQKVIFNSFKTNLEPVLESWDYMLSSTETPVLQQKNN